MTVLNVTLVCPGFCWWLQGGRHKVEPHACCQRQQKEAQKRSEQISAQNYPKFKADISARNTFFEQIYFFFKYCAKIGFRQNMEVDIYLK
jgi:hypothetical protein